MINSASRKKNEWIYKLDKLVNNLINLLSVINLIILFFSPEILTGSNTISTFFTYYCASNIVIYSISVVFYFLKKRIERRKVKIQNYLQILGIIIACFIFMQNPIYVLIMVVVRFLILQLVKFLLSTLEGRLWKWILSNPAISLMGSFLVVILFGSLLLMLPISTTNSEGMPFLDALFTSTSATCVTGLIVEDTGSFFSQFGQIVILLLIQIGGLGLMTISTAFAILFGQKMSAKFESAMQNVMGESSRLDLLALLKYVMGITLTMEFIGAGVLFFTFKDIFPTLNTAIYYSIFHSVSAFCNAGFALFSDSLVSFSDNLNVVLTVSFLIITGGLGFVVYLDLARNIFKKNGFQRLSLHSKIVISSTLILIIAGMIGFYFSEYNYTMKDMSFEHKLLSSYFQSVTCRTAGFNTIDQGVLSHSSVLLSLILMFVGASPGSTGGGIKTTTFVIIILSIMSLLTGRQSVSAFKRKISSHKINEAISLIGVSIGFLLLLTFLLMLLNPGSFEKLCFEAVSAFGTVGLSMNFTSSLNNSGKVIIILLMYLGRIGPLTILYAISQRVSKKRIQYLEERISIG